MRRPPFFLLMLLILILIMIDSRLTGAHRDNGERILTADDASLTDLEVDRPLRRAMLRPPPIFLLLILIESRLTEARKRNEAFF